MVAVRVETLDHTPAVNRRVHRAHAREARIKSVTLRKANALTSMSEVRSTHSKISKAMIEKESSAEVISTTVFLSHEIFGAKRAPRLRRSKNESDDMHGPYEFLAEVTKEALTSMSDARSAQ